MSRSRFVVLALTTLAVGTPACSAVLDWSDFTGGSVGGGTDAGTDGDATTTDSSSDGPPMGGDASDSGAPDVVVSCGDGGVCAPAAPMGWTGPVALYTGSGSAPACAGGMTSLFDGGTPTAPPATCSMCSCGSPNVSCADPVMTLYDDPVCSMSANMPVTPSASCSAILTAAVTVAAPALTGSCAPGTSTPTLTPFSWSTVALACPVSGSGGGGCSAGSSCVPPQGTSTSLCVMQTGAATSCPAGYPGTPQVFYTGVTEGRGCTACTCAAPANATCTIASPAIEASQNPGCSSPNVTMSAPSGCTILATDLFVQLVATPTLTGTASCAVSGGGSPTGAVAGTGATSFCCLP